MGKLYKKTNKVFKNLVGFMTRLSPARVMVLGFAGIIFIGAILLNLPISSNTGESIGFLDALFTSTSAVCVTGLVVVDTGTYWSEFGQTVIIMLIQIGGLGFMTIATMFALISKKKINLKERLLIQESLNQFDLSGVVSLAKNVLTITFLIEGIGALLLSFVFVPKLGFLDGIFYSIFHSISAFCNAGFDLMGPISGEFSSLTSFVSNPIISLTISILIVLGGLGFPVIIDFVKNKRLNRMSLHSKITLVTTAILILIGALLIFIIEYKNPKTLGSLGWDGKILASLFQSVTTRTAGFNTIDLSIMHESAIFIIIMLMFIGASPASTGGGIKTTTFAITLLSVKSFVTGREDVEVYKRRIDGVTVRKTIGIVFIGVMAVISGTIILSIIEPEFNLLQSSFEVVSAFTTAGLSIGGSLNLTPIGKMIIILFMFMGRAGSLTILMALVSKKKSTHPNIRYPEGKVLVG